MFCVLKKGHGDRSLDALREPLPLEEGSRPSGAGREEAPAVSGPTVEIWPGLTQSRALVPRVS